MRNRLLHRIRNIEDGQTATRNAVLAMPALKLVAITPVMVVFAAGMLVEDLTLPGHANLSTTQKFQHALPKILAGEDSQWHLWEVRVYRHRLELDFADTVAPLKKPAAALRCFRDFPDEMDLKIWTPVATTPYFHLIHLAPETGFDHLAVRYLDAPNGLEHIETYDSGPMKFEIRSIRE